MSSFTDFLETRHAKSMSALRRHLCGTLMKDLDEESTVSVVISEIQRL